MNIKTGLSIYNKQWLVEPSAALQMLDFWEKIKGTESIWSYQDAKAEGEGSLTPSPYKIYQKFFESKSVIMSPDNSRDMKDFKGFDGAQVAIICVSGPLMKDDFCGSFGTNSLRRITQMASNTASVKSIVFLFDTPGGTVDGTQTFADTIKASPKHTIGVAEGTVCSAGYWLASACDEIYASSQTDVIGSIGVMCSFYDNTEAMKERGVVLREYYATASVDKNKMFSDAQKGDGKVLIKEMLDPMNNVFMSTIQTNRAGKLDITKENVLTGKTYISENAVLAGLADGIKSFDQIVSDAARAPGIKKINSIISLKDKKMEAITLAELKANHPTVFQEARNEGILAERERVTSALIYGSIDMAATTKLITEGTAITETFRAEMWQKQIAASTLKGMAEANIEATTEGVTTEDVDPKLTAGEKLEAKAESDRRIEAYKRRQGIK